MQTKLSSVIYYPKINSITENRLVLVCKNRNTLYNQFYNRSVFERALSVKSFSFNQLHTLFHSSCLKLFDSRSSRQNYNENRRIYVYRFNNYSSWNSNSFYDKFILGIVGINVLIFLAWQKSKSEKYSYQSMLNHFTLSKHNLLNGRYHTLITSAFSQMEFYHLFVNCVTIYSMGSLLISLIGLKRFTIVYLGGALTSSFGHLYYENTIKPNQKIRKVSKQFGRELTEYEKISIRKHYSDHQKSSLGASGAACSILSNCAVLMPSQKVLLFGIFPISLWVAAGSLIVYEIYSAQKANETGIGHSAHLGGFLFGTLYGLRLRKTMRI